jgi:MoaA/NifB/PqqE/SkfB family radical SAM enzyme
MVQKSPVMFPFDRYPTLTMHISSRCNQKCRFCFKQNEFWSGDNLSFKDVTALTQKGIDEYGIKGIWFGGGEPLLYDSLDDAIRLGKQKHLKLIITTNGVALSHSPEFKVLIREMDIILVSLHSHLPEVHNRLVQNPNSYKEVMETISFLQANNKTVIINCVCTAENYKTLPGFVEKIFSDFPGLSGLQILSLKYAGRALENKAVGVNFGEVTPYLNLVDKICREKGLKVVLRDFPLCLAPRGITAPRYPQNYIGYTKNQEYFIESVVTKGKTYPVKCKGCSLMTQCPGVDINYIRINGTEELNPL